MKARRVHSIEFKVQVAREYLSHQRSQNPGQVRCADVLSRDGLAARNPRVGAAVTGTGKLIQVGI